MAKEFAVATKFTAKDRITKAFGHMSRSAKAFGNDSDKAFRRASRSANKFQSVQKRILKGAALIGGFALIKRGISGLIEQFIDFDNAIIGATARFKDIGPAAADFNEQMLILRKVARNAGATTEFTAAQAGKALDFLARAGFSSREAIGSLRSMINLATASGEEFALVADFSSDLLGAFGLNVDNTAQKIKNLTRLNDVLVKAANTANVTIETQFETMKGVAPVAVDLGISLETLAAATALLGGAGIKGTLATTALRNILLNLSTQSSGVVSALRHINVTIDDGTGNLKDFSQILREIAKGTSALGQLERAKVFNILFGKRAIAGAANLLKGVDALDKFKKSLDGAAGTAELTAKRLRQSLGNRLLTLASAATDLGFKFIDAFEKDGKKGIDVLTEAIRNFDPLPIIDGMKEMIKLAGELFKELKPLLPVLIKFTGGTAKVAAATLSPLTRAIPVTKELLGFGILRKSRELSKFISEGFLSKSVTPPNREEANARREVDIRGQINIAGAPAGSTVTSKTTGAPDIEMNLLGPTS